MATGGPGEHHAFPKKFPRAGGRVASDVSLHPQIQLHWVWLHHLCDTGHQTPARAASCSKGSTSTNSCLVNTPVSSIMAMGLRRLRGSPTDWRTRCPKHYGYTQCVHVQAFPPWRSGSPASLKLRKARAQKWTHRSQKRHTRHARRLRPGQMVTPATSARSQRSVHTRRRLGGRHRLSLGLKRPTPSPLTRPIFDHRHEQTTIYPLIFVPGKKPPPSFLF